jgi:hypothetical protein
MSVVRVIQALFPERKPPAAAHARRFARTSLPAATARTAHAAQRSAVSVAGAVQPAFLDPRLRAPHPALAARRLERSPHGPHPATTAGQPWEKPHAAALQPKTDVRAFRTPHGFLAGQKSGEPLPASLRQQMEGYFETDFSDVRVHVGSEAPTIGALAFTIGTDLFFAPGKYQPHTQNGRELIGHELTHVVQQREGRVGNPFGSGVAVVHDEELEAEADRHGRAAAQAKLSAMAHDFGRSRSIQRGGGTRAGYQLLVGAYLHGTPQPEALAGHSFVAIEGPDGRRRAFGFSPANYRQYDPERDLGRLKVGVEGVVHDDAAAFDKPGVRTQTYSITEDQAHAAMAKVSEYRAGRYRYSADRRQCATFVSDVMHAAGVSSEALPARPRFFYEALDGEEL